MRVAVFVAVLLLGGVASTTTASSASGPPATLAYSCGGICLVGADGSQRVTIATGGPSSDHDPVWSPDGRQLAFVSNRDGEDAIYLMGADGSNVHRLTPAGLNASDPTWSRTNRIAFFAQVETGAGSPNQNGIFTIAPDGTGLQQVFTNVDPKILWAKDAAISPDGSRIAFSEFQESSESNQHPLPDGIYVMGSNGANPTRIASGYSPAWSYDSSRLAFFQLNGGPDPQLVVSGADGSGATVIATLPVCAPVSEAPAWSPDGAWLAYSACSISGAQIDRISSSGGTPILVTYGGGEMAWRPVTPSTGLVLKLRFAQTACSNHPGSAQGTVTDAQSRPLDGATVTLRGGARIRPVTAKTNAVGAAVLVLRPADTSARGRLYLVVTVKSQGRPMLTKKLSLPGCSH